jgi:integrase
MTEKCPDLQHLHATTLPPSSVAVHVLAVRLGHANPAITLGLYAHVISSPRPVAADIFAEAVTLANAPGWPADWQ